MIHARKDWPENAENSGTNYVSAIKAGRSWNGAHRDSGTIVHAVEPMPKTISGPWFTKAVCGATPGRRGYGWTESERSVNCPKCQKKTNKQ